MQEITDDTLSAYLDDELDAARRAAVEAEIARNPVLARRLAALREADALTREAFSGIGAHDVPEPLLETLAGTATATRQPGRPWLRMPLRRLPTAPVPAMMMGLAVGVVLSLALPVPHLLGDPDNGSASALSSRRPLHPMQPAATLTKALGSVPSDTLYSPGKLSVVVLKTFRSATGRVCREYQARINAQGSTTAMAGVACRTADTSWSNEVMVSLSGAGGNEYTPATAGNSLKATRAVWRQAEVLSQKEERALLQHWDTQSF